MASTRKPSSSRRAAFSSRLTADDGGSSMRGGMRRIFRGHSFSLSISLYFSKRTRSWALCWSMTRRPSSPAATMYMFSN